MVRSTYLRVLMIMHSEVEQGLTSHQTSGVARNLSRMEQIRGGLGAGSPPAGPRGGAPVGGLGANGGVWGRIPPEVDELTTKMFRILIAR